MSKRLITVFAAMAAFMALAVVPSVASAIELTDANGNTADTFIRAHNVGDTIMTAGAAGNIVCTKAEMTGHLTQNGPTLITGDISSASFKGVESEERCASSLGATKVTITSLPWCIRNLEGDSFEVRGGKCTEAAKPLTFVLDVAGISCPYEKASVTGTFATHPEEAILTVSESEFKKEVGGGFLCPGSGKLDMKFTLENDTPGTNPLYIDK